MKIFISFIAFLILFNLPLKSQEKNYVFNFESIGGYISPNKVPFWLRSNQFGSIPLDNGSLSLIGSAHKDYNIKNTSIFDWGASLEVRANVSNKSNLTMIEAYAKLRISVFEIRAGRSKEIMGLCDSSLSSGAFAVSGNALGIPKITISIPEFYTLPFFGELFAFKGSYSHGWFGSIRQNRLNNSQESFNTYLHQKSLYGRFGKPEWQWKLYGGFNHQTTWGSEKNYYGDIYTLTEFKTYEYVIFGRAYGTSNIPRSKIGNHLGSIDVGAEYKFNSFRLLAYRQFFYDCGALYHLANLRDGLNGLSLVNTKLTSNSFRWQKMLIEVLYTKNQAGEFWSPATPSGDEDYYNNYQYVQGWSYKGIGLGNPFLSTRAFTRVGLPSDPTDYFTNNRVVAFHYGFEGSIKKWNLIVKTSYSLNYGTFGTSPVGHTLGKLRTLPAYGIFPETKQLSAFIDAARALKNGVNIGFTGAFDVGGLYYNSFGLLIRAGKSF